MQQANISKLADEQLKLKNQRNLQDINTGSVNLKSKEKLVVLQHNPQRDNEMVTGVAAKTLHEILT